LWCAPAGWGVRSVIGLLSVLLAAGCGHLTRTETRRAFDTLPPTSILSAYVDHEHLFLRFHTDGRQTVFKANWNTRGLEKAGEPRLRTTQLKLVDTLPKGIEERRGSVRAVTVASAEQFRALLPDLVERLVPRDAMAGVFLALGDREFVAYRQSGGRARFVPASQAPAEVRGVRHVNPTEVAQELLAVIGEAQRAAHDARRLFLVVGERAGRPPSYCLFDLDQRVVVVATWPGAADLATEQAAWGKGWRMVKAGVIEGQGVSLLKNPVSFAGRAVNFTVQTVGVMLRRRRWPTPEIPPLTADGPGMDLSAFEAQLDALLGAHRSKGAIRLLIDGPGFFPVLAQRIDEAQRSLHFRVCIWDTTTSQSRWPTASGGVPWPFPTPASWSTG
jgi:hypothetical protein